MSLIDVGVAAVDIAPETPIRLNGFATPERANEVAPAAGALFAKAVAFGPDQNAAVLITVDNCAVPEQVYQAVATRMFAERGVSRTRLAICFTHSHLSPYLSDSIPGILTLIGATPPQHLAHITAYTALVTERLVAVAKDALDDRAPALVHWAQGSVGFARNRHPRQGVHGREGWPVDLDLPVLRVTAPNGDLRAVLVNYACHCTNSAGTFMSGDWAGAAQKAIEDGLSVPVAMVAIGCAADANPEPAGDAQIDIDGTAVADEVERLLGLPDWRPVDALPDCVLEDVPLPRVGTAGALSYPVQTWRFGDDLAMVFLAGEVVVDYAARLKTDYDGAPLWINAYANTATPGYVPSQWVVREAQTPPTPAPAFWYDYEAFGANEVVYWELPGVRYTSDVDRLLLNAVESQLAAFPRRWEWLGPAQDVAAMTASGGMLFAVTASGGRLFWRSPDAPVGSGWTDIGEAQQVKGLGAWNGNLFCITSANSLQSRIADTQARAWQVVGSGPAGGGVVALTAIDGVLFAATNQDKLWSRAADLSNQAWTDAGHAQHLVAMAAAQGQLYGATYEGGLFRRPPALVDTPWQRAGLAHDVVALAAIGTRLYRATRLNDLLWRSVATT